MTLSSERMRCEHHKHAPQAICQILSTEITFVHKLWKNLVKTKNGSVTLRSEVQEMWACGWYTCLRMNEFVKCWLSLHIYLVGSHWPGNGPAQSVPHYTWSLLLSFCQCRKSLWWTGSDSLAACGAKLGLQHTPTKQRTKLEALQKQFLQPPINQTTKNIFYSQQFLPLCRVLLSPTGLQIHHVHQIFRHNHVQVR